MLILIFPRVDIIVFPGDFPAEEKSLRLQMFVKVYACHFSGISRGWSHAGNEVVVQPESSIIIWREWRLVPLIIWYPPRQPINQRLGLVSESKAYREDGSIT
ncbi:hypothetical protein TESG_08504 [Trichophyton tonsurans CBS 112818]|uniref:Uncharacterized protein n=1 Tax=Trichophyton tonsurans (strain CBS 112818) TaxID=647933 RepID=F2S273_TRIT1|nr:hypothetical protein TESG_08504 [Trichophyton tonsurans CBS 112818]